VAQRLLKIFFHLRVSIGTGSVCASAVPYFSP
jgi:hypothetical protein